MNLKNENMIEYGHFYRLDAETIEKLREKDYDLSDKKQLYEFCELAKIDITYEELMNM